MKATILSITTHIGKNISKKDFLFLAFNQSAKSFEKIDSKDYYSLFSRYPVRTPDAPREVEIFEREMIQTLSKNSGLTSIFENYTEHITDDLIHELKGDEYDSFYIWALTNPRSKRVTDYFNNPTIRLMLFNQNTTPDFVNTLNKMVKHFDIMFDLKGVVVKYSLESTEISNNI